MSNAVEVRINKVDSNEITNLMTMIEALRDRNVEEGIVNKNDGNKDYVVTVKSGELQELKNALRMVLRVVKADRIEIEP